MVIQRGWAVKTAWLWDSPGPRWRRGQASFHEDSCTLLLTGLLWLLSSCETSLVFQLSQGKCAPPARGKLTYRDLSLHPWSLIALSSWEWGIQIFTVWLIQKALFSLELFWLVGENINGSYGCTVGLDRKNLSPMVEIGFQKLLLKGWIRWQKQCRQAV